MSFIIRATLVIGTLSYLALNRDLPAGGTVPAITAAAQARANLADANLANAALAGLWDSLPEAARERLVQDGAAEIARRVAEPAPPSRDTLADADRKPAWRGIARH